MNFGFSSWNQPVCEEHFHVPPRDSEDESLEENPNVEDLSIGGGEEKDLETVGSEKISSEKKGGGNGATKGGKKKGSGARSRREREGEKYLMIRLWG